MVTVVDIGATKTVIATASISGRRIVLDNISRYEGKQFDSFELVLEKYAADREIRLDGILCIGVAGPIIEGKCRLTNLAWYLDGQHISERYQFDRVVLLNDLEASGYGLDALPEGGLIVLNEGVADKKGNRVLIAPGTGLGEAIVHRVGRHYIPIASEGGHADFAPFNGDTRRLWEYLRRLKNSVCYEDVLSGPGLENIFDFLLEEMGVESAERIAEGFKLDPGKAITTQALDSGDVLATATLTLFLDVLASEAANMALKCLATGGIYIGGGIVPRIHELIDQPRFLEVFSNKEKHQDLLRDIPIKIILDTHLPLYGAATCILPVDE